MEVDCDHHTKVSVALILAIFSLKRNEQQKPHIMSMSLLQAEELLLMQDLSFS